MIETAVILAAGMGTRLKDETHDKPKGFLVLDGLPIVENSIRKLLEQGIKKIVIGTGFLKGHYEALEEKYPGVTCVHNPIYSETGSMQTLFFARERIEGAFLLLESDLVYDKSGLRALLDDPHPDAILASGKTGSGDEVYLEVDETRNLKDLSKKASELDEVFGELVGITKLSGETFRILCAHAEEALKANKKLDYEKALAGIAGKVPIFVHKIEDYLWGEIDDASHLERVSRIILPRIKELEA